MLKRFYDLLPFIDAEDEELAELLPPPASKRRLRDLLAELKDIESVSKALRESDVKFLDVRAWFDGFIASKQPYARSSLGTYLPFNMTVISDFEAGCVRVLEGQIKRLTRAEKAALEPFLATPRAREDEQEEKDEEESLSFVEKLQKRRRLEDQEPSYMLLASIPLTSNVIARTTLDQQRHALQPYTLEVLLFLRQNADYWDARTVESAA
ncbi:Hypothetical protein PHPALM_1063 [Phytophthora palmivora]|uniref:PARP alpha-helical domain-containing protein n=1 Tax=Phytophthora palmivora TaxID=4796 RepID=A0A2P4YT89_9STRA|nr:Hypothetical protein PHPALM_1063 [Phytophthora palmivora]